MGAASTEENEDEALPATLRRRAHAHALLRFGSAMLEQTARVPGPLGSPMQLRIGVHVGRVVAGVIGTSRFRYDVWGSDVLTAMSVEAAGVPGAICVSEKVLKHVADTELNFVRHATVALKTRDGSVPKEIESYRLLGDSRAAPVTTSIE
uniref:adenylate cyclase n=2 Tax=Chrysotila carterae TaxID=13221 RepID=A0A7S4EWB4_CHRCT